MAVRTVEHECIDAGLHECLGALHGVGSDADARGDPQTALCILAGERLVFSLRDVLVRDQSEERSVFGHHRQFLDFVFLQDVGGAVEVRVARSGDKSLLGHHVTDVAVEVLLETEVAVGDDAHEDVLPVHHRNATDVVVGHDAERVAHRLVGRDGHRRVDHAVLSTLDRSDLFGLLGNRHILVYHTDAALPSDGNRHLRLGDRVHGRRNERQVQPDIACETRPQINLSGKHIRIRRYQQHVVKRQPFQCNSFCIKGHNDYILFSRKNKKFMDTTPSSPKYFFISPFPPPGTRRFSWSRRTQ